MLNIGINVFPATCCRRQSAAALHLCWARNVAELMRPATTSWQAIECTLLNLPLWLPSNHNISSFVIFQCLCMCVCAAFHYCVYLVMWVCASQCQHNRKRATWAQRGTSTAWECQRSSTETLSASSCMWRQDSGCLTWRLTPNRLASDPWKEG